MNILLVDDNRYVLDGLLNGIDFSGLGFDKVYTARSAKRAEEILYGADIHIMIADIEMPGENGLKLLERINDLYPDIVTIFCTSFADFNYAQAAIRLKCFDYYVKPIKYEIFKEYLVKAIAEVKRRFLQRIEKEYGSYWRNNYWNIKSDFWRKLLYSLCHLTWEDIEYESRERNINYTLDDEFSVCIIKMGKESKLNFLSIAMAEFVLRNITEEIFLNSGFNLEAIFLNADDMATVIFKKLAYYEENFGIRCQALIKQLSQYISAESNCYFISKIDLKSVQDTVERLEESVLNDVTSYGEVIDYESCEKSSFTDAEAPSRVLVNKVKMYIDDNYWKNITRTDLEKIALVNISTLSKSFKDETGHSLHKYVLFKRISRAKQLLEEGRLSVSEVSLEIGYDNFSYFSRMFKERTGMTPKEYKNKNGKI